MIVSEFTQRFIINEKTEIYKNDKNRCENSGVIKFNEVAINKARSNILIFKCGENFYKQFANLHTEEEDVATHRPLTHIPL